MMRFELGVDKPHPERARVSALTIALKKPIRSAWQTAVVGGLAAAAAFVIAS
jgi:hypothetical protein